MPNVNDNVEVLRSLIEQGDIGTPGGGLLSEGQFDAWWELAQVKNPWASIQSTERRTEFTGNLNRTDFGDDIITPAAEGVDSGTFFQPDQSQVPFVMTKGRVAIKESREVEMQAHGDWQATLIQRATRAFGRSFQRLAWISDEASADPNLAINTGWLTQMIAGSATVAGGAINGGDVATDHFYAAIDLLSEAWKERTDELKWAMTKTKEFQIAEFLSGRATGQGDKFVERGPDGGVIIAGIESVVVPTMGTRIALTSPENTAVVIHPRQFTLEPLSGDTVKLQDILAWVGFYHADYVFREIEGTALIDGLNA